MRSAYRIVLIVGMIIFFTGLPAFASEDGIKLKHTDITMDRDTLRRGLAVFTETCMGCHSAKYVTYRDLMDYPELGLSREDVDDLRGERSMLSGLFTELAPEDAKVSYGKMPPDLSVITRARPGPDYIYSLLIGFAHDPDGRIPDGHYNIYFPGHNIAMPDPLSWLDHDMQDEKELEEQARTVSSFMAFIGEPHQQQRKRMGVWVLAFLVILTAVLYALKREVWSDIKH